MNDSKIPVRYSKSVFELARERGCLDRVYEDMGFLRSLCSMHEVREVLDNPVITSTKRREIIGALVDKNFDSLTLKFLDLVFSEGREKYLPDMARDFIDLTRKYRGISEVTITTTSPMSEDNRNAVVKLIGDKMKSQVELIEKCDTEILGGFILQVDDTYIDASVKSRINRFRKEFGSSY
jgi:F-type H+-transporting ATPase subunit delta